MLFQQSQWICSLLLLWWLLVCEGCLHHGCHSGKYNKQKVDFTHKTARIDRIYVTESLSLNILKCKHLNLISDHKLVLLELHLEDFKPWGNFYWKLNSSFLEETQYVNEIDDLFNNFI